MKHKIIILGYGILGKVMHSMLVECFGDQLDFEICDKQLGTPPLEDFDTTHGAIIVNCTKTPVVGSCDVVVFKTDNISSKTSVIIENLRNRVEDGDVVTIYRDYDIDRESTQQEDNVRRFLGVDCKIFIKKHDKHEVIYEIGTKYKIVMDSPESERMPFMKVLFAQLLNLIEQTWHM